jgi:phosphoglycerate dehydrogenase-like enzyme
MSARMKLVLRPPYNDGREELLARFLTTGWTVRPAQGAEALARELADADAVVAMSWGADAPPAPKLRLLQLPGAGLDAIDLAAVPKQAALCNVYEHEIGMAEHCVLVILEWLIGLRGQDRRIRQGDWSDGPAGGGGTHGELFGKTVGIVGYGRIGRETAKRLKPFGVRILACTRSPEKRDAQVDEIAGMERLPWLLGEADFVILACPLDETTRGLIDARAFAAMKPGALLINVARGAIVDEDALYDACKAGRIGGAAIDVWQRYPKARGETLLPSRHPLHELENVILTPHTSGWSAGLHERRWRVIAQNLDRLARGEPLLNLVRAPG